MERFCSSRSCSIWLRSALGADMTAASPADAGTDRPRRWEKFGGDGKRIDENVTNASRDDTTGQHGWMRDVRTAVCRGEQSSVAPSTLWNGQWKVPSARKYSD